MWSWRWYNWAFILVALMRIGFGVSRENCGKSMKAREIIRILEKDGWRLVRQKGSHMHFEHSEKTGITTVPFHGSQDLSKRVLASILKQAGLK
jgi:predicted RNA binding protein YcfA (HicA-like mRNA interferase family)